MLRIQNVYVLQVLARLLQQTRLTVPLQLAAQDVRCGIVRYLALRLVPVFKVRLLSDDRVLLLVRRVHVHHVHLTL